ncbi:MAG: hypothetical protein GC153_01430 [Alphaproteobacteria bacterium]|nr:hypothetical protein [Alphaproteobacteria bacterium]
MRFLTGVAAALATLSAAGAACATTFDLSSTAGWTVIPGGYQQTVDGITLTVTAGTFTDSTITPGGNGAHPQIYNGYGTGVWTNNDSQHTIDGSGYHEFVMLSFSQNVILDALRFSYFDSLDDFDLFADTNSDSALEHLASDIDIPNNGYYSLSTTLISSLFGVGADHSSDSFKLKKVYVTAAPEVPLPMALPLFLSGAAGLGFAGFARKKRAA